jgi:hypothetical protein
MADFFYRLMRAILFTFQAAGAAVEIDPRFFAGGFPKGGVHGALKFNPARLTIEASLRMY